MFSKFIQTCVILAPHTYWQVFSQNDETKMFKRSSSQTFDTSLKEERIQMGKKNSTFYKVSSGQHKRRESTREYIQKPTLGTATRMQI